MDADLAQQEFVGALQAIGGSSGNSRLRDLLGWSEADYESVKAALVTTGQITPGRGHGGSVAMANPAAPSPASKPRCTTQSPKPVTTTSAAPTQQPSGK